MFRDIWLVMFTLGLSLGFLSNPGTSALGFDLFIANSSFESPALDDAVFIGGPDFASQGGYGWSAPSSLSFSAGVFNAPENTYFNAAGNGTPQGADGVQAGFAFFSWFFQTLIGPDRMTGSIDDPFVNSQAIYTLTVAVGKRRAGTQYGDLPFGEYKLQLLAGSTVIAEQISTNAPPEGTFVEQTLTVNTATIDPSLYGKPISIWLFQTQANSVVDFDNVWLAATITGDFDDNGTVDAADYTLWRDTFGQAGAGLAADGNGDLVVDEADYELWAGNFGGKVVPPGGDASSVVPEPYGIGLWSVGFGVLFVLCLIRLPSRHTG